MFSEALLMRWVGWRRGCMYGGWRDDLWRGEKADIRMLSFCFSTTLIALLHERKDKKEYTHTQVCTSHMEHCVWNTVKATILRTLLPASKRSVL